MSALDLIKGVIGFVVVFGVIYLIWNIFWGSVFLIHDLGPLALGVVIIVFALLRGSKKNSN